MRSSARQTVIVFPKTMLNPFTMSSHFSEAGTVVCGGGA